MDAATGELLVESVTVPGCQRDFKPLSGKGLQKNTSFLIAFKET